MSTTLWILRLICENETKCSTVVPNVEFDFVNEHVFNVCLLPIEMNARGFVVLSFVVENVDKFDQNGILARLWVRLV